MTNRFSIVTRAICAGGFSALMAANAGAAVTFSAGDASGRNASAVFDLQGGSMLVVTLTNDTMDDVLAPVDILTALFFDVDGASVSLTPVSALLNAGSVAVFASQPAGGNVGGEWAYGAGIAGPEGTGYGISSAGFGLFGGANFLGPDLDPPGAVNGLNYGLTSTGDNLATGNTPVTGSVPLVQDSVVFTLSGLPSGFDLGRINNVWFQYGTGLDEPRNPAPGTAVLLGIGGLVVGRRRR
ncbi:hypothetical protein PHYC_02978 [Phycisphaerales bacterium]|nr:hypothetical protein PHYC_02978 [Phycisphaerales bacterium]